MTVPQMKQPSKKQPTSKRNYDTSDHRRMLTRLKRHIKKHGPLDHTGHHSIDATLVLWSRYVRSHILELSPKLLNALMETGFFSRRETRWLERFQDYVSLQDSSDPADRRKRTLWASAQRGMRDKLQGFQIALLQGIDFDWTRLHTAKHLPWQSRYAELVAYKERFGHCEVPAKWPENSTLGMWVSVQRLKKANLTPSRIKQLDAIGFVWNVSAEFWKKKYKELQAFYKAHGHSNVPEKHDQRSELNIWVGNMRRRSHRLSKEQLRLLEKVDFCWNIDKAHWEDGYARLKAYHAKNGHCLVPARGATNCNLGIWVSHQRHCYKVGHIDQERVRRLNALGFVWDAFQWQWEQRFNELKAFKKRFGHCRVPLKGWGENPTLGRWLSFQRNRWERLSAEQQARLGELGVSNSTPTSPLPKNIKRYLQKNNPQPGSRRKKSRRRKMNR